MLAHGTLYELRDVDGTLLTPAEAKALAAEPIVLGGFQVRVGGRRTCARPPTANVEKGTLGMDSSYGIWTR